MKKIMGTFFLLILPALLYSQDVEVSGSVSDDSGQPLPGVNIVVKNTNIGTASNADGNFSLVVPNLQDTLVFSFVGYRTRTIPINGRIEINVEMQPKSLAGEEVVVTALGIEQESKAVTYSTSTLDTESMTEARPDNLINSLSGQVAGVHITNSGTPTGSNRVEIRGVSSLSGNNQPLYIVNGVQLENSLGDTEVQAWTTDTNQMDYGDPLANINPDDIESIEVLKGAKAAALYGSRAANGVILITTKTGKTSDGWGVSLNSNTMFTRYSQLPEHQYVYGSGVVGTVVGNSSHLDPQTGLPDVNNHAASYGSPLMGFNVRDFNGQIGTYSAKPNNVSDLYDTGITVTNGFSLENGTENATLRFGYTNTSGNWMMKNQEQVDKHNLSLRATLDVKDKLNFDVSLNYTNNEVNNRIPKGGSFVNPAQSRVNMHPNMGPENLKPWKDPVTGQAPRYALPWLTNPYWLLNENHNQDITDQVLASGKIKYELAKGLSVRGKFSGNIREVSAEEFYDVGASFDPNGAYRTRNSSSYNWNFEGLLMFSRAYGDFTINGLAGGNIYRSRFSNSRVNLDELAQPDIASLANNAGTPTVREFLAEREIQSLYSSATFGYKDMLFIDASARNDWSSTLPLDNNSYFYPSVGASFIFSEILPENEVVSFGKLRASYARVGNDAAPHQLTNNFNFGGTYRGINWVDFDNTLANPDLKPELKTSYEAGLNTRLFQSRITLDATYYHSSTTNQILNIGTSASSGFTQKLVNAGEIQNEGVELLLGFKPIQNRNFIWDVDLNWSTNRNKVVSLITDEQGNQVVNRIRYNSWLSAGVFAEVGKPFGVLYVRKQKIDEKTGRPVVNGTTGTPVLESNQLVGNINPDWNGGVKNSFNYKNLNLSFLIDYQKGGNMFSATVARQMQFGINQESLNGRGDYLFSQRILGENNDERKGEGLFGHAYDNMSRDQGFLAPGVIIQEDGTRKENDIYISPQQYYGAAWNNMGLATFDRSYVKLREVILGYTLPQKLISKTPLKSARISLVGRNLAILFQNTPKGLDPEAATSSGTGMQGIEFGSFMPSRSYGFNIKLSL